ncbi:hypothetical protein H5410_045491 [Solanum commersonii]|uniref:Uncharacterized protein n=1 Tax=Solanum commersonii TaxID=4109 RepID=A0A9J5X9N8_SOLCO|nr:hypothetical protein H5410_045491 [Solanum commersonii]
MLERLFDGYLLEGRGPESNILAVAAKLVAVISLASLRGDTQPTLLEQDSSEKDEEVKVPFVWRRKGVRGAMHQQWVSQIYNQLRLFLRLNFTMNPPSLNRKENEKARERW